MNVPSLSLLFYSLVSCLLKQELQQKEKQWSRRCEELQGQVQQLQEDRKELQSRLKGSHSQDGMFRYVGAKRKIYVSCRCNLECFLFLYYINVIYVLFISIHIHNPQKWR